MLVALSLHQPRSHPPRRAHVHASIIAAAPPTALPPGAAPEHLEDLLLRVLEASEGHLAGSAGLPEPTSRPAIPDLCDDLAAAGFVLLSERETELAEVLQPTAAERLAVRPQLGQCDPSLTAELDGSARAAADALYGGRAIVWRRGYSSEGRNGRLFLEKLDYLQVRLLDQAVAAAGRLVDRLAGWRAGGLATEEEGDAEDANGGVVAGGAGVDVVGLVRSSLADAFDDAPSWPAALLSTPNPDPDPDPNPNPNPNPNPHPNQGAPGARSRPVASSAAP